MLAERGILLSVGLTFLVGRVSAPELMDGRNPDPCLALDRREGPPPETSTGGNVQTRQGELVNLSEMLP